MSCCRTGVTAVNFMIGVNGSSPLSLEENFMSQYYSLELAAEPCTTHMYCNSKGSKGEERKQRNKAYSGAKCSTVERWFLSEFKLFFKCICTRLRRQF
jgi:hypothetical protein